MRLRIISIVGLVVLAIGSIGFQTGNLKTHASTIQSDHVPRVFYVRVKGKKLFLTGENFMEGAVILIDGEPQKTRNDEESPSTDLIAKKGGNHIADNTAVTIQVEGPNGKTDGFPFFKGLIVTFENVGKPILLKTGDRFLLFLAKGGYQFSPSVLDTSVLQKVDDVEIIPGSQGVFEARRPGTTTLNALGELPCHKTTPACLSPTLNVEFNVIVSDFKLSDQ